MLCWHCVAGRNDLANDREGVPTLISAFKGVPRGPVIFNCALNEGEEEVRSDLKVRRTFRYASTDVGLRIITV